MTAAGAKAIEPTSAADVRLTVIGVLFTVLLSTIGQTIVAPALPSMAHDFGQPLDGHWIVTAYLVTGTASTPIFGKLCDTWGRRRTLELALAFFIVGSALCGFSATLPAMVAARAVQGVGGGALVALALIIVADVVAPRERGRYQVYMTSTFVAGALAGPILGGVITQNLHWSVVFWLCVPLGLIALGVCELALRCHPRHERPQALDWPGAVLLVGATVTLLAAVGGHEPTPIVIALLAVSVGFWALLWRRLLKAREPLIPIHILSSPLVLNGSMAATFTGGTVILLTTFLPSYFQNALHLSVSAAGFALTPLLVGGSLGSVIAGQTMVHRVRYRRVAEVGLGIAATAAVAAALVAEHSPSIWLIEAVLVVLSIGSGTVMPITTFSIQNAVELHDLGVATSTNNFVRQLGSVIMVAVVGSLLLRANGVPTGAKVSVAHFGILFWTLGAAFLFALGFLLFMEERPLRSAADKV